ncbi:MAG: peptidoglycan/xylan/chitin deacetylase (PgdA/CDA1 family) [Bradymonadia bacterium]|jgi:peptidoglycan/xylan/chitin deacetylase (PgdA/CDA1 family)
MSTGFANISIDLDGLSCYYDIHGLDGKPDPTVIYDVALPRFLDLVEAHGARATLFVITADLEHDSVCVALRDATARGHEVASHSHSHFYDLRKRAAAVIADELDRSFAAIEQVTGRAAVGFRTPGYNIDDTLLRALVERGVRYDSSVFACPPYYAAKAAVMGVLALRGTPSRSSMTDPSALRAPIQPYRPSTRSYARDADGGPSYPIWEFPIGVVRGVRFPVIGTSIGALSARAARGLAHALMAKQPVVQLEFHGIDFLDHVDDAISAELVERQPDVRRSVAAKNAAFDAMFRTIGAARRWRTLEALADDLDRQARH